MGSEGKVSFYQTGLRTDLMKSRQATDTDLGSQGTDPSLSCIKIMSVSCFHAIMLLFMPPFGSQCLFSQYPHLKAARSSLKRQARCRNIDICTEVQLPQSMALRPGTELLRQPCLTYSVQNGKSGSPSATSRHTCADKQV